MLVTGCLFGSVAPLAAQAVLEASPNLAGAWVAPTGVVQFNLLHRFHVSPAPVRKLTNVPTLLVAAGVTSWATAGFSYGSSSELVAAYPNEWEWFARVAPLRRERGAPVDAAVQVGYNLAARSTDAGLTLARSVGPVRLLATGVMLSSAFDSNTTRWVVGGGGVLRLRPGVALAGDAAALTDRGAGEDVTWSVGLQLAVPASPHSLSLHVSNVGTRTLQGLARGTGTRRVGFEYTIPITLRRYLPARAGGRARALQPDADGVVRLDIRQLQFSETAVEIPAGTTVEWINHDPLPHTVTADDGGSDSGLIDPGAQWRRRFDQPGRFAYHCTPHPFMKAVIVVR